MFSNVAYRVTVYKTGSAAVLVIVSVKLATLCIWHGERGARNWTELSEIGLEKKEREKKSAFLSSTQWVEIISGWVFLFLNTVYTCVLTKNLQKINSKIALKRWWTFREKAIPDFICCFKIKNTKPQKIITLVYVKKS